MKLKNICFITLFLILVLCGCVFGRVYGGSVLYEIKFKFSLLYFLPFVLGAATFYIFKFCTFGKKTSLGAALGVFAAVFLFTWFPAICVYGGYAAGNFIEVTGSVEDFETSDKKESFTLNGVEFNNYAGKSLGYGSVKSKNGVVKENSQLLYIRYIKVFGRNVICYIESIV